MQALRSRFGNSALITAAITADGTNGGKIDAADYAGAAQYLDWYMPMTYDYFGAFAAQGPTAPHSPLTSYTGIPTQGFHSDAAIQKLKSKGIPASKLLLGIGFYGRGWTGVTQSAPGGTRLRRGSGHLRGRHRGLQGPQDPLPGHRHGRRHRLRPLRQPVVELRHPPPSPSKMTYAKNQGLGGAFFWETSGDTANGELITAISNGLK